jgi:hypothetical protein
VHAQKYVLRMFVMRVLRARTKENDNGSSTSTWRESE